MQYRLLGSAAEGRDLLTIGSPIFGYTKGAIHFLQTCATILAWLQSPKPSCGIEVEVNFNSMAPVPLWFRSVHLGL